MKVVASSLLSSSSSPSLKEPWKYWRRHVVLFQITWSSKIRNDETIDLSCMVVWSMQGVVSCGHLLLTGLRDIKETTWVLVLTRGSLPPRVFWEYGLGLEALGTSVLGMRLSNHLGSGEAVIVI